MDRRDAFKLGLVGAGGLAMGVGAQFLPIGERLGFGSRKADAAGVAALFGAEFEDADGKRRALRQWQGRVVVVNFWATWCPPCVDEMPDLQRLHVDFEARGAVFLGIGIDSKVKIRRFRDEFGIGFPLLVADANGSALAQGLGNENGSLPYTAVITREGRIGWRHLGRLSADELRDRLGTLTA